MGIRFRNFTVPLNGTDTVPLDLPSSDMHSITVSPRTSTVTVTVYVSDNTDALQLLSGKVLVLGDVPGMILERTRMRFSSASAVTIDVLIGYNV